MNWFKENPVPAGILGAGLLLALGGTWLAINASTTLATARETLAAETTRLQRMERRQPPLTAGSSAAAKKSLEDYEAAIRSLATTLAAKEEPLEDISPEKFQDELRKAANQLAQKAAGKNTTLPESFLLGFEEFQSQLPPPDQTPALHREFKVVNRLLNAILDLGISEITLLKRGRDETEKPAEPEPPAAPGQSPEEAAIPRLAVHPFQLVFSAKQDVVLKSLDLIPAESQFLVIRSLSLENSAPEPPSTKNPAEEQASPLDALLPGEVPQEKIDVVFGRETVKASLDIELLDFPDPPAASPTPPPATQPTPAN